MTERTIEALAMLGTPAEIRETMDRLAAMDDVDMADKRIHFSIHAAGHRISVLVHEVLEGSSPLLGAFRFTAEQWDNLKRAVDPLVEAHIRLLADGERMPQEDSK